MLNAIIQIEKANNPPVTLTDDAKTDLQSIRTWLKNLGEDIEQDFDAIATQVANALNISAAELQKILGALFQNVQNALNVLSTELQTVLREVVKTLCRILGSILPALIAVANELDVGLDAIISYLPGVVTFLGQLVTQHVPAYAQLLGVTEFAAIQKTYRASIPYTPPPKPKPALA